MISKLRERSSREIFFRAGQEIANISMFLWPPSADVALSGPLAGLPDPKVAAAQLQKTPYAAEIDRLARDITEHRFPLLGLTVTTGPDIDWRKDYPNNKTSPLRYMRRVPYLDFSAVGDHKNIWELNRHQHLVLLAQAYLVTRRREYLVELLNQLEGWFDANPFMRGINWTSALEVAFRALSWTWISHLVSNEMEPGFRNKFLTGLYRHGCYLEHNLSVYFAPNTHLLGEAVALHALGTLFPGLPRAATWRSVGATHAITEMQRQVRGDGSHFEQSTYYHVYALDMFAFHFLLNRKTPEAYRESLVRMAQYLEAVLGPEREISCFGDDDGGRFFHPYGCRTRFGRGSLAVVSQLLHRDFRYDDADAHEMAYWWLGRAKDARLTAPFAGVRIFQDAGMVAMAKGDISVYLKYGPMATGGAGHSHADLLSLTACNGGEKLLVDAGTYTYVGDPQWRNWFRGTAAHNTVVIDGLNQATPTGPFRWTDKPDSTLESETPLTVNSRYHGFLHRRRLIWKDLTTLLIIDEVSGQIDDLASEHEIAQMWHSSAPMMMVSPACFQLGSRAKLWTNPETSCEYCEGGQLGWMSPAFGVKEVAAALRVVKRGQFPIRLAAVLDFEGHYMEWQPEWSRFDDT